MSTKPGQVQAAYCRQYAAINCWRGGRRWRVNSNFWGWQRRPGGGVLASSGGDTNGMKGGNGGGGGTQVGGGAGGIGVNTANFGKPGTAFTGGGGAPAQVMAMGGGNGGGNGGNGRTYGLQCGNYGGPGGGGAGYFGGGGYYGGNVGDLASGGRRRWFKLRRQHGYQYHQCRRGRCESGANVQFGLRRKCRTRGAHVDNHHTKHRR